MKFTLTALLAIISAASAISVDAGLVKRQCIANGGLCLTGAAETAKSCCPGFECKPKAQSSTNICEPEGGPVAAVPKREVLERSGAPPAPRDGAWPRPMPEIPRDEPIWG